MVPKAGLEPARVSPLPPQDSVSTKFHHFGKSIYSVLSAGAAGAVSVWPGVAPWFSAGCVTGGGVSVMIDVWVRWLE